MTLFFPDLNVWLALSDEGHSHHVASQKWLAGLASGERLVFSRFTQIGLLRLLTNQAVMKDTVQTLAGAWRIYDRWLENPRVEFCPEPHGVDAVFRKLTRHLPTQPASKAIGGCWRLRQKLRPRLLPSTALFTLTH